MEAVFEYEIDGVVYSEKNPPAKFIDDLLDALQPFLIPTVSELAQLKLNNIKTSMRDSTTNEAEKWNSYL